MIEHIPVQSHMIDWRSLGYAKAMMALTAPAAPTNVPYPTQDKYTPENEHDYIAGYNEALKDYQNQGFNPVMAYALEKIDEKT